MPEIAHARMRTLSAFVAARRLSAENGEINHSDGTGGYDNCQDDALRLFPTLDPVCVCVCVCVRERESERERERERERESVCVCVCVFVCVCMHVCMYVCMYVCIGNIPSWGWRPAREVYVHEAARLWSPYRHLRSCGWRRRCSRKLRRYLRQDNGLDMCTHS